MGHLVSASSAKIVPIEAMKFQDTSEAMGVKPGVSMWPAIARARSAEEAKERLKSFWTTMGVVSALLMAFSYPAVVTPPTGFYRDNPQDNDNPMVLTFAVLNALSLVMSMTVVMFATVLLSQMDFTVSDEHTLAFIDKVAPFHEILVAIFCSSVVLLGVAVLCITWYNATQLVRVLSTGGWVVLCAFVAASAGYLGTWNRAAFHKYSAKLVEEQLKKQQEQVEERSG